MGKLYRTSSVVQTQASMSEDSPQPYRDLVISASEIDFHWNLPDKCLVANLMEKEC